MSEKFSVYTTVREILDNTPADQVIGEVFDRFELDCFDRSNVNPDELDMLIRNFESSGCVDCELLCKAVELIQRGRACSKQNETALIQSIRQRIDRDFTDDIRIEEIAGQLYVSYYHMCHIFKKHTGMSVNMYRTRKRLELAARELVRTDKRITDIAVECGFNSVSYFTEVFGKMTGMNPISFRERAAGLLIHEFYGLDDILLAAGMKSASFLAPEITMIPDDCFDVISIKEPDEEFGFIHEAAVIEFGGVLYASWYGNRKTELHGLTPIFQKRSFDGGKTWSEMEIIAEDRSERLLYCPPVYGIDGGRLYMLINSMTAPDHIHSLDMYILNPETDRFELLRSMPIAFKLNTNVVRLPNGKLMLPGRVGELDRFPNTPAVMISDSGRIDADWRIVRIAENGDLPDGKKLVFPELSVMIAEDTLYMFNRNDQRRVPLVYISKDFGESWSEAFSHDIPYISSKIYCGELSCGRHYIVCNIDNNNRSRLALYLSEGSEPVFKKRLMLLDLDSNPEMRRGNHDMKLRACHYPCAYEYAGMLYVIATLSYDDGTRAAVLHRVRLDMI